MYVQVYIVHLWQNYWTLIFFPVDISENVLKNNFRPAGEEGAIVDAVHRGVLPGVPHCLGDKFHTDNLKVETTKNMKEKVFGKMI